MIRAQWLWICFLACIGLTQLHAQSDPKPCLTDEATRTLRQAYPQGVPNRNLPDANAVAKTDEDFTYYIPVVVHVMQANGPETLVTPAQIEGQIRVMNEGFGRYGHGANSNPLSGKTNLQFCLAKTDPNGMPTLGYEFIQSPYTTNLNPATQDTFMKRLTIWDPNRYMNVWVVRQISNGFEGYTYLPEDVAGTVWDGIIIAHRSFGVFPQGSAQTLGYTMTHEAGHFFGLYHPWGVVEDTCGNTTDYCDDTPPVAKTYFAHATACTAPLACDGTLRQVANYMDYSDDYCQNMFTQCQVDRILDHLIRYRAEMASSANLLRTGCISALDTIPATDSIYVYPVPASNAMYVNVDFEVVGSARIQLTDLTGRVVYTNPQASVGRGPFVIDVSQMSQGSYVLRVTTDKADLRRRVNIGGY